MICSERQVILGLEQRAKDLVHQILMFSRPPDTSRQPLKLSLLVKEVLSLLRASLPTTITLHQDIPQDVGTILADPTQIYQVVLNLCANAEYAMRETGGL